MSEEENVNVIRWFEHQKSIIDLQKEIYEDPIEFDVKLISDEGRTFKSHKLILSGSSDFFHMILKDVPASEMATVHLPDVPADVIKMLLDFIYTGQSVVSSNHLTQFFHICTCLKIKGVNAMNAMKVNVTTSLDKSDCDDCSDAECDESESVDIDGTTMEDDKAAVNEELIILEDYDLKDYLSSEEDIAVEYLDSEILEENSVIDEENMGIVTDLTVEPHSSSNELTDFDDSERSPESSTRQRRTKKKGFSGNIERAFSEISTGKTIHQLSLEYKIPKSTLYHKFRSSDRLRNDYRSERKCALDQAVSSVLNDGLSLKKAADRFAVPKTAIWRELRKSNQYQPPNKNTTQARIDAQTEIMEGKSLTSISTKYGIPMTTLHRDKKRLSLEGKLPEHIRVRDRTENSEYGRRLEQALKSCQDGMSQYQASKIYNIPKATMWRYAHGLNKNERIEQLKNDSCQDDEEAIEEGSSEF